MIYIDELTTKQQTALNIDIDHCLNEIYMVSGEEEIGQAVSFAYKMLTAGFMSGGSSKRAYRWNFGNLADFESVCEKMGYRVTAGRTVRGNRKCRVIHA